MNNESGPRIYRPRVSDFTMPKSRDLGIRRAFGNYDFRPPFAGPQHETPTASYFTDPIKGFRSGLARVIKNGRDKIIF